MEDFGLDNYWLPVARINPGSIKTQLLAVTVGFSIGCKFFTSLHKIASSFTGFSQIFL
jgi:hypothetical protein